VHAAVRPAQELGRAAALPGQVFGPAEGAIGRGDQIAPQRRLGVARLRSLDFENVENNATPFEQASATRLVVSVSGTDPSRHSPDQRPDPPTLKEIIQESLEKRGKRSATARR
jgi:hypothetical protein